MTPARVLLLCAAWVLTTLADARACTCGRPSDEEAFKTSLIFRGTVLSVEQGTRVGIGGNANSVTIRGPQAPMQARFRVVTPLKGPRADEMVVGYVASDGANCGTRFEVGKEVVVFASGTSKRGFFTSMCHGFRSNTFEAKLQDYVRGRDALVERTSTARPAIADLRDLASFFERYHDLEEAEESYGRLLELAKDDIDASAGRARIRFALADFAPALEDFQAVLRQRPDDVAARRGETLALVRLNRVAEIHPDARDFTGLDSGYRRQVSFAASQLPGAIFREANLNGISFNGADLTGADFSNARFHTCDFAGAQLGGASFDDVKSAYNTSFEGARLEYATFRGAYLQMVNLNKALLHGVDFAGATFDNGSMEYASIEGASFRGATFHSVKLRGSNWSGFDLSGVKLLGVDLRDADLTNAILSGASFRSQLKNVTDMRGTDLRGAYVTNVDWGTILVDCRTRFPDGIRMEDLSAFPLWVGCPGEPPRTALAGEPRFQGGPRLSGVDAPGIRLPGRNLVGFGFWTVKFDGADFRGADLSMIDIQGGSYAGTDFSGAKMQKAGLRGGVFDRASFRDADLGGARLNAVDLRNADIKGANFAGACFDPKTQWPDGFDPLAAGATPCR